MKAAQAWASVPSVGHRAPDFFPSCKTLLDACGLTPADLKAKQLTLPTVMLRFLIGRVLEDCGLDEAAYLTANPDVKQAVQSGRVSDGTHHFVTTGFFEGRDPGAQPVDDRWYVDTYPDIKFAIDKGWIPSASQHFYHAGAEEGRARSERYRHQQRVWTNVLAEIARQDVDAAGAVRE